MAVTSRREWRKKGISWDLHRDIDFTISIHLDITLLEVCWTLPWLLNKDIDFVIYSVPLSNGMVGFDLFTLYSWFLGCHRNEPGIVQTKLFRDIDVNFIFSAFYIPVTALLFGIVSWQQLLRMFVGQLSVNCGLSHRNDFGAKRGKLFLIYFLKS